LLAPLRNCYWHHYRLATRTFYAVWRSIRSRLGRDTSPVGTRLGRGGLCGVSVRVCWSHAAWRHGSCSACHVA